MEIAFLVLCALILGAFGLRIILWALKSIYKYAPLIVITVALLLLSYNLEISKKQKVDDKNATIVRPIKD